jgi:hypothetical protein
MSVYDPLRFFLAAETGNAVSLSFRQIETMLKRRLPPAARDHGWWWANEEPQFTRHVQCRSWQAAGWRMDSVDRRRETVRFIRR